MSKRKKYTTAFKAKVVLELLREEKPLAQVAGQYEVHPTQLRKWKQVAVEHLPSLFTDSQQDQARQQAEHERQLEQLYAEIGRLTTQLAWLKKKLVSNNSRGERRQMIERNHRQLPLTVQCRLLGVSRSSLYYQPRAVSPEEVALKHRIDEIYTACPFYGSRRIAAQLQREGHQINRKRVQRYMRQMGIRGICPGPNLSRRAQQSQVYPYLLRGLEIIRPNQVWGIDITYLRLVGGWLYLVAVLDWYSRYVVSWELDQTLELPFVLEAMRQVLQIATPEICNTDQGSQFTSPQWAGLLQEAGVSISMDGKGRAIDNIYIERFFRTLKYNHVYLHPANDGLELYQGIKTYIRYYNDRKPHQGIDHQIPADLYRLVA